MAGDPYPGYYLEKTEVKPLYHADGSGVSAMLLKTYRRNTSLNFKS